jgi:hypothetical protein
MSLLQIIYFRKSKLQRIKLRISYRKKYKVYNKTHIVKKALSLNIIKNAWTEFAPLKYQFKKFMLENLFEDVHLLDQEGDVVT